MKLKIPDKRKIIDWLLLVCFLEKTELIDLNYVFCTDEFLLQLNLKYLHHSDYTDVITFDYSFDNKMSAEVFISVDRVIANASKYTVPFIEELRRVMLHGVLHCIGYTDKSAKSKSKMRKMESKYLKLFYEI